VVATSERVGWADPRHGVELKEGQQIFRTYKGKEYRATATDGYLIRMDNGVKCNSLNQLSRTIHDNVENAWNDWCVALKDGQRQLITGLGNRKRAVCLRYFNTTERTATARSKHLAN
jgi:hypothetical protein